MKNGIYQLNLKNTGGTKGTVYKHVIDTNIDFLFALCGDGTMFLIPREAIKNKSTINLNKSNSKFNSTGRDYSKFIVTF